MDAPLVLEKVSLFEGRTRLLGPVSWTVGAAERWVVLGSNGSGKTSLMRIAGGTRLPSRGRAFVLGEEVGRTQLQELQKRIGFMSDELERRFDQRCSALEVVTTARHGAMRWWRDEYSDDDWARGRALLERTGCSGLEDRLLGELSEGERQRVLFARALMCDPAILLLDEPTAGLDPGGREQLLQSISVGVDATEVPVVLVTHHVEEIPPGFTHALMLKDGRLLCAGPIDECITDDLISECFGVPLTVLRIGQRYTITLS